MVKDDIGEAPEMRRERQAAHDVASWDAAFAAALASTTPATNDAANPAREGDLDAVHPGALEPTAPPVPTEQTTRPPDATDVPA
jgi:hypothetical protein